MHMASLAGFQSSTIHYLINRLVCVQFKASTATSRRSAYESNDEDILNTRIRDLLSDTGALPLPAPYSIQAQQSASIMARNLLSLQSLSNLRHTLGVFTDRSRASGDSWTLRSPNLQQTV